MPADDLDDLYQRIILDHARAPRHFGRPEQATHHAEADNPLCGDQVEVYLSVDTEGRVAEACFTGRGCAISIASASLMTEAVCGCAVGDATELARAALQLIEAGREPAEEARPALAAVQALGGVRHFPSRIRCATLAWTTLVDALRPGPEPAPPPASEDQDSDADA